MRLIKKLLAVVLVLTMMFTLMPAVALASDTITVTIDGQRVTFADQQPVIINNRTLVPVGGVFEALGFTPSWSGSAQTATLTRAEYTVVITIGSATFTTNGAEHTLDVPAQIINNRTMLPLRAVLESIGISPDNIGWDGNARAITIVTGEDVTPPVDPAVAEAELTAFLLGIDIDLIRYALDGIDFTIGMSEYIDAAGGITSYRFIYLDGELPTDLEFNCYRGDAFGTQTGDVILVRGRSDDGTYILRVDIGRAADVLAAAGEEVPSWFTDNHRAYHRIFMANLYIPHVFSITHFLNTSGHDLTLDILGVNFIPDSNEQADDWGYNVLALQPATPIDIARFEPNYFSDTLVSQTGDVFLLSFGHIYFQQIGSIYLYIDLGTILDFVPPNMISDVSELLGFALTINARAYYRVQLF